MDQLNDMFAPVVAFFNGISGPEFLKMYALWAVGVLLLSLVLKRWADNGSGQRAKYIEENPDPYGIAYLRGYSAVGQLAVVRLMQEDYAELSDDGQEITLKPTKGRRSVMNAVENRVLLELKNHSKKGKSFRAKEARKFFKSKAWKDLVERSLKSQIQYLKQQNLLIKPLYKNKRLKNGLLVLGLAPAVLKGGIAYLEGHRNILYLLFLMGAFFVIQNFLLYRFSNALTRKGKRYLRDLKSAYQSLVHSETPAEKALALSITGVAARSPVNSFIQKTKSSRSRSQIFWAALLKSRENGGMLGIGSSTSSYHDGCSSCNSCSSCSSCGGGCGGCGD